MAAMTFTSIVDDVRNKFADVDVSSVQDTFAFQFNVEGKAEGVFYVEVKDGKLNIEPYDYHDHDALIRINGTNLIKLINGKLDPVAAFTTGKIKIEGNMGTVLELIRFIK